jgi:hypothetical protein
VRNGPSHQQFRGPRLSFKKVMSPIIPIRLATELANGTGLDIVFETRALQEVMQRWTLSP